MRTFLETQRATMLSYLSSRKPESVSKRPSTTPIERIVEVPLQLNGIANHHLEEKNNIEQPQAHVESPVLDREAIAERLLGIVRDRTGYPAESLRLDLDLEADLGIDSIKRVEILSTLRDTVRGLDSSTDSEWMDTLGARTLGAIVDHAASVRNNRSTVKPLAKTAAPTAVAPSIQRFLIETIDAPFPSERAGLRAAWCS